MRIDQIKCDFCFKVHEVAPPFPDGKSKPGIIPLHLGDNEHYDFCDEDCLRYFLMRRKDANR